MLLLTLLKVRARPLGEKGEADGACCMRMAGGERLCSLPASRLICAHVPHGATEPIQPPHVGSGSWATAVDPQRGSTEIHRGAWWLGALGCDLRPRSGWAVEGDQREGRWNMLEMSLWRRHHSDGDY